MERRINRRRQGDLGELSAMGWLASKGAVVWIPFGHSPDIDLIAEIDERLLRIQVKTCTYYPSTPSGRRRWYVGVVTNGGNQSWSGVAKKFDPSSIDFLFVLVGDGRRWFIPAGAIDAERSLTLGGPKYSEFEIEQGDPIMHLVYDGPSSLELKSPTGECPSGQREHAVNVPALSFAGSNPASPTTSAVVASTRPLKPTRYERKLGQSGQAVINQKRRITIPQKPFFEAGFENGSRVRVRCEGPGRVILEQVHLPGWACADDDSRNPGSSGNGAVVEAAP